MLEKQRPWRRRTALLASMALALLVAVCGGTYAYFTAKDQVVNRLDMANLDFEIEEPSWEDPDTPVRPGDVLPKDPQIVNTGEAAFVVRVKIQEVWTPKDPTSTLQLLTNPDYVRYFAADSQVPAANTNFSAQQLLNILRNDSQLEESAKNFALRLGLTPNATNNNSFDAISDMWTQNSGWYRGSGADSQWLYYNQIVDVNERTEPVFRAITIRTEEELEAAAELPTGSIFEPPEYEKYNLDIYIYAETVQADAFAWKDAWGEDIPEACATGWGGST